MDIVIAIDRNYIEQSIVLIYSIILSNKNSIFNFFVLTHDLSEDNKDYIRSYFKDSYITINFISVDLKLIKSARFSSDDYITLASYYRLLIPILLPLNLKKVLYLDCDMLIIDSLDELWKTNIDDYSTAVTTDAGSNDIRHFSRLNIPTNLDYFNAGMLLINLDYWRDNFVDRKTIDFIKDNKEACKQHDQDALNKILLGTVKYLSVRFNYLDSYLLNIDDLLVRKEILNDIVTSASSVAILHFSGGEKPWHTECVHPYAKLWQKYYKLILKHNIKKSNRYKGLIHIKKVCRKILVKLKLVDKKYKSNISQDIQCLKRLY